MKKEFVVEGIKVVSGTIAGIGAKKVIKFAVEKVVPETLGKSEKVLVAVGTFALAGTIGTAVANSIGGTIDEAVETIQMMKESFKEVQEKKNKEPEVILA